MVKISGVIITFNEERHIEACIRSLMPVVDELIVVDSYSADNTAKICKALGVKFVQNTFEGHIEQKNFAMQQASHPIILSLDADERLSDSLQTKLLKLKQNWTVDAVIFNRFNNYCGKWLRFAWYPDRKLRLWDKRKGRWGGNNPHDHVIMNAGSNIVELKDDILHYAYADEKEHLSQIERFAKIAAKAKYDQNKKVILLWHLILSPIYRFIAIYILKLGFLDGYYGFSYSKNASYLNFLKYKYLWMLRKKQ